jgi:hypothetical protein
MRQCKTVVQVGWGLLLVAVLLGGEVAAQPVGPQDPCRHLRANPSGIAKAPIVVSNSPVVILTRDATRCGAIVTNRSSTQTASCMTMDDGVPTAAAGFPLAPLGVLNFTLEAQEGLRCIREGSVPDDSSLSMATWEWFQ